MHCSESLYFQLFPYDILTGCDGKPHSDKFLQELLDIKIEKEEYEDAETVRKELVARGYAEYELEV